MSHKPSRISVRFSFHATWSTINVFGLILCLGFFYVWETGGKWVELEGNFFPRNHHDFSFKDLFRSMVKFIFLNIFYLKINFQLVYLHPSFPNRMQKAEQKQMSIGVHSLTLHWTLFVIVRECSMMVMEAKCSPKGLDCNLWNSKFSLLVYFPSQGDICFYC
jgi:hypothetical protein